MTMAVTGGTCSGIVYYAARYGTKRSVGVVSPDRRAISRDISACRRGFTAPATCSRRWCFSIRRMRRRSGRRIAAHVKTLRPTVVLSPALGGLIIGHEVARALGVRAIFAERAGGTALTLRRGFTPRRRRSRARRRGRVHDGQVDARDDRGRARGRRATSSAPRPSSIAAAARSTSVCRHYALIQLSRAGVRARAVPAVRVMNGDVRSVGVSPGSRFRFVVRARPDRTEPN